ncbi:MAG: DUF4332 domain-containing protein, partial [Planctomycetaceae bacterium]|nr:DUF4332 domain-containing protein [Planctomycetaceae bacterium]
MRFTDIHVDRFGVLNNSDLRDLSRGLTVVYGNNGSGKTTLVSFLRGLLFGYNSEHAAFQENDGTFGGTLSLESRGRAFRLARERRHGITSELTVVDAHTNTSVPSWQTSLPEWVNETVHREIFTVGDQEAARFDLLSRLCLDGHGPSSDAEIQRTEHAIQLSVREREGHGIDTGLRQKMTALRQRREELTLELAAMRRANPEIPARIAALEAELSRLRTALVSAEQQISATQTRIRELEELLERLRRQNVVGLDRSSIEAEISRLSQRQQRWQEIRQSIRKEITSLNQNISQQRQCRDSLKSIRALVSRLEQRVDSSSAVNSGWTHDNTGLNRDVFTDHIRSEVFSLCEYVRRHESAIEAHEASLESLIAQRALSDAENIDAVLQGQIDALKEELSRSRDVLDGCRTHATGCTSTAHAAWQRTPVAVAGRSIQDVEAELASLRSRLESLRAEQADLTSRIRQTELELERLRSMLQPAARLEDLDQVRSRISEIDAELVLLQNRHDALERSESQLRNVVDRLKQYQRPHVLEVASGFVNRLTDGDCYRLTAADNGHQILAETRQSQSRQTISQLSRGTRDQVALALRLALIECRAEGSDRCPLLLDDVFITSDDDRAAAAADLLMEIAADGQQIIFFTCQSDVLELFKRRHAAIRYLEPQEVVVAPIPVSMPMPVATLPPRPVAPPPAPRPVSKDGTNWLFYLEVDNSVEDLSGLTVAEVEAFRASGIQNINDLLTLSVDELEERFRQRGYSIGRDRIRAWRGQAELALLVPMLRRSDAELLYAAGIQSTVELSRMRPETVFDVVTRFQESSSGHRYRKDGRTIDRQQAINWSRWAQHARSLSEARATRSRFFVRSSDSMPVSFLSAQDRTGRSSESGTGPGFRRSRMSRSGPTTRLQRRPRLSSDYARQREDRLERRRRRLSRHSASYRTAQAVAEKSESVRELRFFLSRSDDIEAAPSIGPRTAQHLSR